ncbi:Ppx/GppA phosphatase family protein [Geobacter argillaceus]|uniref:Ppx/GppA phosphatase n=1 Tax=Geobacter argillaceus TaxID=345631 RepID=A0A562VG22_9BACT|nr:Ppx/GppA phosphatase family protein [Geobacter argillaceus]TWJ16855.1 Ppx/GppA phosphatase [Geobacter argillaceus]
MKGKRLAAIDIGTNSIRCIVVEADQRGTFRILDDEKATVRLGEGLNETGIIAPAAWQRAMDDLSRLKKIIDGYGVSVIEAVATSAVRKAANGKAFIAAVRDGVGLEIRAISGEEEAELAALSAFNNFELGGGRHLLVDIGGGSLELVTTVGQHIEEIFSLELGAVYLTETFLKADPLPAADLLRLRRHVRKTLKQAFADERPIIPTFVGSGGTITSIAVMTAISRKEAYGSVHGYELLRSDVVHILAMLLRKSVKERRAVPGLNPDRADIIVAGVVVIDELMEFCQANLLKVNERGIREGLILRGLRTHGLIPGERKPRSWRESVLEFAASCHYDEKHSLQVARLALDIFKAVAKPFKLGDRDRHILEAAAILHDIGYFINYSSHHKHSYHLIRHGDLFGFTPRERELIANVARYHRKSLPKKKHETFMRLSSRDRELVAKLGGILRLADGLDRRRVSSVVTIEPLFSPSRLVLRLHSDSDISVEIFGGSAKCDLFQESFGLKLVLEPASARQ